MKNFKITIPIKYHTDDTIKLEELGITTKEYQVKNVTFYSIDAVGPNLENPEHALVYSCGTYFTTIFNEEEVINLIDKQLGL